MINSTALNFVLTETPSRALARQCRSKETTTRRVSFIETHKKWGSFSVSLGAQKVIEQFPQGNSGEGLSNAQKVPKSGGVSFISLKIDKKLGFKATGGIYVK